MDPLSDVLRAVRLDGAFFYLFEGRAPWAISVAPARELMPPVLPQAEHLMAYHIVTSGSCWMGTTVNDLVELHPGDAILFPHGDAHVASSRREDRSVGRYDHAPSRPLERIRLGADQGERTELVCGFLGCDTRPYNPLLSGLPRSVVVRGIAGGWLAEFPRQVVAEAWQHRAGGATMLTRMAELMFVEVLRRYSEDLAPRQAGWLAGLRDPLVGAALALLHERPAHPWTLADLAREIATSRTILSERFSQAVGLAPMQYLTEWRLQLAAEQLASGPRKVAAVAADVGYESEAAFSRAFKRRTGHAPAAWRRLRQSPSARSAPGRARGSAAEGGVALPHVRRHPAGHERGPDLDQSHDQVRLPHAVGEAEEPG
jgi:AraC-like DNA-binding protein